MLLSLANLNSMKAGVLVRRAWRQLREFNDKKSFRLLQWNILVDDYCNDSPTVKIVLACSLALRTERILRGSPMLLPTRAISRNVVSSIVKRFSQRISIFSLLKSCRAHRSSSTSLFLKKAGSSYAHSGSKGNSIKTRSHGANLAWNAKNSTL